MISRYVAVNKAVYLNPMSLHAHKYAMKEFK